MPTSQDYRDRLSEIQGAVYCYIESKQEVLNSLEHPLSWFTPDININEITDPIYRDALAEASLFCGLATEASVKLGAIIALLDIRDIVNSDSTKLYVAVSSIRDYLVGMPKSEINTKCQQALNTILVRLMNTMPLLIGPNLVEAMLQSNGRTRDAFKIVVSHATFAQHIMLSLYGKVSEESREACGIPLDIQDELVGNMLSSMEVMGVKKGAG